MVGTRSLRSSSRQKSNDTAILSNSKINLSRGENKENLDTTQTLGKLLPGQNFSDYAESKLSNQGNQENQEKFPGLNFGSKIPHAVL